MNLVQLSTDEPEVRRYVETLRVPYQRELAETVAAFGLADDPDLADAETEFVRDRLEGDSFEILVAVDPSDTETVGELGDAETADEGDDLASPDGTLAGFVSTELDDAPETFDRPDRLIVCDLYVREPYRGTELARELVAAAADRAAVSGYPEVALDVDVDNERARAFYEKLGFEPLRERLVVDADEVR